MFDVNFYRFKNKIPALATLPLVIIKFKLQIVFLLQVYNSVTRNMNKLKFIIIISIINNLP